MSQSRLLRKFLVWRIRNMSDKQFVNILSVIIGVSAGFAAVVIKNSVHLIESFVHQALQDGVLRYLYFLSPIIGIAVAVAFIKYAIRRPVQHGIPGVLYAISTQRGKMNKHNMFSSIITSSFSVGFGGSVGLEGPTVATGAAIGANIGSLFRLRYKQVVILLGCACAGAMASIFKAPIAAIVFVLEVVMLSMSMSTIVPVLLASVSATLTSFFFMGQNVVYSFQLKDGYSLHDIPSFVLLGVLCGFLGVYFKSMYIFVEQRFERIQNIWKRLLVGGGLLGLLVLAFPALYGEGYEIVNAAIAGNYEPLLEETFYGRYVKDIYTLSLVFLSVILLKVFATSLTFGAGGIGGIFAPTLFIGANTGLFIATVFVSLDIEVSVSNFVLLGMGGMIASVLHAPLTAIFLIADLTGGYGLLFPLMVTSTFSFACVRMFDNTSVYTHWLAKRKQLFTHNKDKALVSMLKLDKLLEKDFGTIHPDANLGHLVEVVKTHRRNIYPVVDDEGVMHGLVKLDEIRSYMFDQKKWSKIYVRNIMHFPEVFMSPDDDMDHVVAKISGSKHYNFPVIKDGKYLGFVSRAKLFSAYRKMHAYLSDD